MSDRRISVDAQVLYDFGERGEMVDLEELRKFGHDFFDKIKVRGIHKRLSIYIDDNEKEHVQAVCELPQDMLAWAAFLHCFFEQKPLEDSRIQERYGLKHKIYETLNYVEIMQRYSEMQEKDMEILDLEDIVKRAIPEIRKYKGIN